MMNSAATKVTLPSRIDFDGAGKFKPGCGFAGWTVYEFASVEDRDAFMVRYPGASMPCWKRVRAGEV